MNRNAKIVLVVHCLLNVNTKVEGLANYGGVHPLIHELSSRGYGVVQLPCPEMISSGLKRWAQSIEQYDHPRFRAICAELAEDVAAQVMEYARCGYAVGPVIGFEGSPSCVVTAVSSGEWGDHHAEERMAEIRATSKRVDGSGIFIRELVRRLEPIGVGFIAIDEREGDDGVSRILAQLEG